MKHLCQNLLAKVNADVVHLDMTLGGISVENLSPWNCLTASLKSGATEYPKDSAQLRNRSRNQTDPWHRHVAIGKEGMLVRIAELTASAEAILYACQRSFDTQEDVFWIASQLPTPGTG